METKKFELVKEAIGYSIPNTAKGKLYKNPSNAYMGRATKLDGRIVYIRTADGFRKMIQTTIPSNYKYFDFDSVKLVPNSTYNASSGNLAVTTNPTTPPPSSFDGVANTDMLDDSFSNVKGRLGKYYPVNEFQNQVSNAFAYRYLPTQTAINGAVPRHNLPDSVISNRNRLNDLKIHRNVPSEFVTHKTIVNFDGEIVSNFSDKEANDLANTNKVVYTEAEALRLYANSGSKKPFRDWLKSDDSRQFFSDLANIGAILIMNNAKGGGTGLGTGSTGTGYVPPVDDKDDDKGEATILGMHPVTFTLVSIGVLGVGFFGIRYLIKKGKGK